MKKLGPYQLDRLLGRGGMGSVYIGVHEQTGETAAIKALANTLADDENFRARFLVEIETLKQLRHPNIVQILGDGEEDGQLFYVMELVEGKSLQEVLQGGHVFEWQEVVGIAVEICGALKHAHDCGVIHRDIKPANLLRTPEGRIKLTDFGIAKLFGATHRTADGSVVGTADYMAPEQADGRPVTNRTDLYSLGAVMFTLLARRTPFQGGSLPQVIHRLKYEEAPSVRRYAPSVPNDLDMIIGELLRKDPQQRVATALTLANRLRAMEHALSVRDDWSLTPDDQVTRLAPNDGGQRKDSTSGGEASRDGATKIDPTAVVGGRGKADQSFFWNEATVVTSAPNGAGDDALPTLEPAAPPAPKSRFTTIDEDRLKRAEASTQEENRSSLVTMLGLGALLLLVIAFCVWGLLPKSADALYRDIQATVQEKGPADAWREIEQFLRRYPSDPRANSVAELQMDVESDWLDSRLRLRKRKTDGLGLEAYEQEWLEAYLLREKEPAKSQEILEAIIDKYEKEPNPSESLQTILSATRHQLKRLKQPPAAD